MDTMDHLLKCLVRYDGTDFAGWQVQPDVRTVQGVIEGALTSIAGQPITILGAGRTDAGVHALGQVFTCQWPKDRPHAPLQKSLSSMLSPEIRIESVDFASQGFHVIGDAKAKRYAYTLSLAQHPDPFSARYAWAVSPDLNLDEVARLARRFEGRHDFVGYACAHSPRPTTVRELYEVRLVRGGVIGPRDDVGMWHLVFYGEGFLYKMIRNLTATIVDVARGKLVETDLEDRLVSPGPYHGFTAPAHGLALMEVEYGDPPIK